MHTIVCKEWRKRLTTSPENSFTHKVFFAESLEDSKTLVELLAIDKILKEILMADNAAKDCVIDIDMVYKDTFYVHVTNFMKMTELTCEYTICP